MKKIISILLTLQLVVSMLAVANAEGTKYYYTEVDLTNYFDTVAFLSDKSKLSDYASPNLFIETNGGKSSTAFAVDKTNFDQKYTNGKFTTEDGTPYAIKSNDGTPGAFKAGKGDSSGNGYRFSSGYYSQIKVLALRPLQNPGVGGEHDYVAHTTFSGSTKNQDYYLNNGVKAKNVGTVKYINDDSTANKNLLEYTLNTDNSTLLNKVTVYYLGRNTMRVIAVTLVQTDADVKKYIDEKVSSVLALETPSEDKVLEISEYMDKMSKQGFDLNTVTGITEFNQLKSKFVSVKDYKENTDSEYVKMSINFSTPVTEDTAVKSNFSVTRKNENVDFELETVKTGDKITGVVLKMKNDINYSDEIKIVVSKNLKNADDEKFTLGKDKEITFTPTAPTLYIKGMTVTKSGDKSNVNLELKNNSTDSQNYVLIVGIYSKNNEMIDKKVWTGTFDPTDKFEKEFDSGEYTVEATLLNSLTELKILDCKNSD